MKKNFLFYITFFTLIFVSCNSDDDVAIDPIVGKWTLSERFIDGESVPLEDCNKNDEVVFAEDETLLSTFYIVNGIVCEVSRTAEGTWKNLGDNKYSMTESGEAPYTCELSENGEVFSIEIRFEFQGKEIFQKDVLIKN